jgi:hypothetical protein
MNGHSTDDFDPTEDEYAQAKADAAAEWLAYWRMMEGNKDVQVAHLEAAAAVTDEESWQAYLHYREQR